MKDLFLAARAHLSLDAIHHPRIAVSIGRLLALAFTICFLTGIFSHFLQHPLPFMVQPTRPVDLYRFTQGAHVLTGILSIPLLLAKLRVVYPLLFRFPPLDGFGHFLERASITLLVSTSIVQVAIGLMDSYEFYPFPFNFLQVHYALAYVIMGSLLIHIGMKLPVIRRWWRKKDSLDEQGELLAVHEGEGELGRAVEHVELSGISGKAQRWLDGKARR